MAEWYFMNNGQPNGPHSQAKLKQAFATGKLPPAIPVWNDSMSSWQPADTLPEFAPPPPKPAPQKLPERVHVAPVVTAESRWSEPPGQATSPESVVEAHFVDNEPDEPAYASPPPLRSSKRSEPKNISNDHTEKYLASLRRTTCYKALRFVITVLFYLLLACVCLVFAFGTGTIVVEMFAKDGGKDIGPAVVALFLSVLGIVVVIAWRDASVLLIDIADTLLRHHASVKNADHD